MCFPRFYEPHTIETDWFGQLIDPEELHSLFESINYLQSDLVPWPDANILAFVVPYNGIDLYIYQSIPAMHFSHLFFNTPLYVVCFCKIMCANNFE